MWQISEHCLPFLGFSCDVSSLTRPSSTFSRWHVPPIGTVQKSHYCIKKKLPHSLRHEVRPAPKRRERERPPRKTNSSLFFSLNRLSLLLNPFEFAREAERDRREGGSARNGAALGAAGVPAPPAAGGAASGKLPGPVRGVPRDPLRGAGDDRIHLPQVPAAADAAAGADGPSAASTAAASGPGHRSDQDPAPLRPLQGHPQRSPRPRPLRLPPVRR